MATPDPQPEDDKKMGELAALFAAHAEAVNTGNVKAARVEAKEIFQHIATMPQEPSPWLAAMTEAHRCEVAFDWVGAEAAYRRGVEVTADSPMGLYGAYRELSAFYRLREQYELALDAARQGTEAARRMSTLMMVPIALHAEAVIRLRKQDYAAAWRPITEGLDGIEDGPSRNLPHVLLLTARAQCLVEQSAYSEAQADLDAAWEMSAAWVDEHGAGGWQSALAAWWAATARLRAKQGDTAGAVEAWREAVARRRIVADQSLMTGLYTQNHLAVTLWELGQALRALDDPAADDAFAESHALREYIGLPPLAE